MFQVELDNRRWATTMGRIAKINRNTAQKQLKLTARLVVEDAIAMTPPIPGRKGFGKGNATVGARQKAGHGAVQRDILKTMWPIGGMKIMSKKGKETRASASLSRYLRSGNTDKLRELLHRLGIGRFEDIAQTAQPYMHEDQRFHGVVPKKRYKTFLIVNEASVNRYIALRKKEVWKGVSGWNKAAGRLHARAKYWPKAAQKHHEPGHYKESTENADDVFYEFGNKSRYMQSKGRELNIMQAAFAGVEGRMKKDLETKLALAHAKAQPVA